MRTIIYYWDVISNLVQRDIKLHYRRSALGILWAQINPLLTLVIFSFVFQKLVPLGIPNYPAYVFVGLLTWNWFSTCITSAPYSLIFSRDLVRKPKFPTEIIVGVSVVSNLVNLLLALPILLGLLLVNGLIPNWTLIFFPLVLFIQFLFTLGLSLMLAATNVFFQDIIHIVGILVTVWFYITPIFYQITQAREYAFIVQFNPMALLIEAYRQILLFGHPPDFGSLFWTGLIALIVLLLGLRVFSSLKYGFVDEL